MCDVENKRSSPLRNKRRNQPNPEEPQFASNYVPTDPMRFEPMSPEYKRRDLTDNKHRIHGLLEQDSKAITAVGGKPSFDNDDAYMRFVNTEKKALGQKSYLLTNVPPAPAALNRSTEKSRDDLVWPNIKEDKNQMINWSKLPDNANTESYLDRPDDKYYQYIKNARNN